MQIVRFDGEHGREMTGFASVGFRLSPIVVADRARVACVHLAAGDGIWEDGEQHDTRSDSGLTAIVVEGDGLEILAE